MLFASLCIAVCWILLAILIDQYHDIYTDNMYLPTKRDYWIAHIPFEPIVHCIIDSAIEKYRG